MSDSRPTKGRIVWHDLMTTDPKASLAFFTGLLGWTTKEVPMGPVFGNYTMFGAGGKDMAGMMPLDGSKGIPSHFLAYISVDDIDEALAFAEKNGGKIAVPKMDVPNVGTFAVVLDPQGGVTSPMKMANSIPEDSGPPPIGDFCWEELMTMDPGASIAFYTGLYGWTTSVMPMPEGDYTLCSRGDRQTCGMMKTPSDAPQMTYWMAYIHVEDVDASAEKAKTLGGMVLVPPMDIPNIGRFSCIADPTGATFALFKGAQAMTDKPA